MTQTNGPLPPGKLIHGKKIYLRLPRPGEMDYIRWLWSDPETMAEVGGPVSGFEGEHAARWFARMVDPGSSTECYCLIFDATSYQPVGEVSFHGYSPHNGTAIFNVKVQASERGKGYGPDATLALLRFFFGPFGGKLMIDPVAIDNLVGRQTLLRFGFEHDPSTQEEFVLQLSKERFHELYDD
jgi:RimJ/RimL family protein N-acetyltransferase